MEKVCLREFAAGGRLLGARASALPIRDEVERLINESGAAEVDFDGVSPTQSFIDELVGVLVLEHGEGVLKSLIFKNCSADTKSILHFVIGDRLEQVRSRHSELACC